MAPLSSSASLAHSSSTSPKSGLSAEYGLEIEWSTPEFQFARWIAAGGRKILDRFVTRYPASIAEDSDDDLVFLARTAFDLEYTGKHNEDIAFSDVKDIHRASAHSA